MIIASIRVQATCVLMVTKPEASAQKSQKLRVRYALACRRLTNDSTLDPRKTRPTKPLDKLNRIGDLGRLRCNDSDSRGGSVAADEGLSDCKSARRSASTAVTPMMMFIAAAIRIVVRTPMAGNRTKPAINAPSIAPARLQA